MSQSTKDPPPALIMVTLFAAEPEVRWPGRLDKHKENFTHKENFKRMSGQQFPTIEFLIAERFLFCCFYAVIFFFMFFMLMFSPHLYLMLDFQVDRGCHKVSAKKFDDLCKQMLQQSDDMSGDIHPHTARTTVDPELATDVEMGDGVDFSPGDHPGDRRE